MRIVVDITNCRECPHFKRHDYSTDGWDRVSDWHCTKADKAITSCIDWHEESREPVPTWCPAKLDEKN
jgi:hypothetical protein